MQWSICWVSTQCFPISSEPHFEQASPRAGVAPPPLLSAASREDDCGMIVTGNQDEVRAILHFRDLTAPTRRPFWYLYLMSVPLRNLPLEVFFLNALP